MPNPNGRLVAPIVAATLVLVCCPAVAATGGGNTGLCKLIMQLQSVFKVLRVMAFVGAGFILAKYGWEAITSGKLGGKETVADGLKAIGVPMIVGFALLFSIGIIMGFLTNGENFGCAALTTGW